MVFCANICIMSKEAKIPLFDKEKRAQKPYIRRWLGAIGIGLVASTLTVKAMESGSHIAHPDAMVDNGSSIILEPGVNIHNSPSFDYKASGLSTNIIGQIQKRITIDKPVFVQENTGTINNITVDGTEEDWVYVGKSQNSPAGWVDATQDLAQGYVSLSNGDVLPTASTASSATWNSAQNQYLDPKGQPLSIVVSNK